MKTKFAVFTIIAIIIVIGLGVFLNKPAGPSKLDGFAQALKTDGAKFYGAFWCPHCQAEKALFGSSVKYLPYIECSTPDRQVTQICVDNKIESYPTWFFKDGITVASPTPPSTVCNIKVNGADNPKDPQICTQIGSQFFKTYVFDGYRFSIRSPIDPVHTGSTWTFPVTASTTGEVPLQFLADQIHYTLPQ